MTLCWLSDAISVSLTIAHAHDTPRHNDRHAQAAWRHLICCLTYNLDLNLFLCLLELKSEMESGKQKGRWKWHAAKFSRPISDSEMLERRVKRLAVPEVQPKHVPAPRDNASLVHVHLLYHRKSRTCNFCVAFPSPRLSLQHESLFFCQLALLKHEIHWVEHKCRNVVKIDVNLIFNDALPGSCRIFSKNV